MLKRIQYVIIVILLLFVVSYRINAINSTPSSGSYPAGSTVTLNLSAVSPMPSGNFNTAVINLHITNGTITNFIDPTGPWLALPTCTGFTKFTATDVCVSVANTDNVILAGAALGQVVIHLGSSGTTTVTRTDNTGYQTPDPYYPYLVGIDLASFTISAATSTPTVTPTGGTVTPTISILPRTGVDDSSFLQIIGALVLIATGLFLYRAQHQYLS